MVKRTVKGYGLGFLRFRSHGGLGFRKLRVGFAFLMSSAVYSALVHVFSAH